jgi:PiT family inorganic phosphate transporter
MQLLVGYLLIILNLDIILKWWNRMIFQLSLIMIIIIIIGFYMAWNIGANDLANSMASAVGAKAVSLKTAIIYSGILALLGAVFVGSNVTDTIRKGIINPESGIFDSNPEFMLFGALASLLGASFWITIATWKELPISTTHSIVGGLMGFGIAVGGWDFVDWGVIGKIAASWAISPIVGGIIAYFIFKLIMKLILNKENPLQATKRLGPIFIGFTFFIILASLFMKTPAGSRIGYTFEQYLMLSIIIGTISGFIGYLIIKFYFSTKKTGANLSQEQLYNNVEEIFRKLQILTSCYVAFALGANDVANAIGPMAAALSVDLEKRVSAEVEVPLYLLLIGGLGIAIGMGTWGFKVIKTIGTKITHLTNTRGFTIDFGAATSVLLASKLGMPVSTTHAVVGAVIGVGLARGLEAIDLSIIKKIVVTWIITVPVAALTAGGLFLFFASVFV